MVSVARRQQMTKYLETQRESTPNRYSHYRVDAREMTKFVPKDELVVLKKYNVVHVLKYDCMYELKLMEKPKLQMDHQEFSRRVNLLKGQVQLAVDEANLATIVTEMNALVEEYQK